MCAQGAILGKNTHMLKKEAERASLLCSGSPADSPFLGRIFFFFFFSWLCFLLCAPPVYINLSLTKAIRKVKNPSQLESRNRTVARES